MAIDAAYSRPRTPRRDAHILSLLALGAALDAAGVALIVVWNGSPTRVLGVVILIATIGWFALGPRGALLTLAALWGIVHSILSATDLGGSVGGQSLNLSRGLGAAIVIGGGLALLGLTTQGVRLAPPLKAAAFFLVLYAFDAVVGPFHSAGLADLVRVASGVFVGLVAYYVFDTSERLLLLARVVFWAGVVVGLITVSQFALIRIAPGVATAVFGSSSVTYSYNANSTFGAVRVLGPLGGPGETAGFLLVAAAFGLLAYALVRERERTRVLVTGLVVISLAIVATLTRSSAVGLVVLILLWMLQRQFRLVSAVAMRTKILALFAALALVAVPLIGSQNLQARIWDLNPTTSGANFAQGRAAIWSLDVARLKASSLAQLALGHGAHTAYATVLRSGLPSEMSPHNLLIWLALETGVMGTVIYLAFLFGAGRAYIRAARDQRFHYSGQVAGVAVAALIAYQVQGLFTLSPNNPGHGLYFMLFVGATLRGCADSQRTRSPTEPV